MVMLCCVGEEALDMLNNGITHIGWSPLYFQLVINFCCECGSPLLSVLTLEEVCNGFIVLTERAVLVC